MGVRVIISGFLRLVAGSLQWLASRLVRIRKPISSWAERLGAENGSHSNDEADTLETGMPLALSETLAAFEPKSLPTRVQPQPLEHQDLPSASTLDSGIKAPIDTPTEWSVKMDDRSTLVEAAVDTVIDGRYLIQGTLASGGAGTVFRGRHLLLDRAVAIKVLHPELIKIPKVRKRFLREARTTGALHHPHVVEVLDFGITTAGLHYLVMELLDGRDVGDALTTDGPFSLRPALEMCRQVCDALQYIHDRNLIHRDLKPSNIWTIAQSRSTGPWIKLLDFGVAGLLGSERPAPNSRLTAPGGWLEHPTIWLQSNAEERTSTAGSISTLWDAYCGSYCPVDLSLLAPAHSKS